MKADDVTMARVITFLHIGQFKGSAGSEVGCGSRTMPLADRLRSVVRWPSDDRRSSSSVT
jgi:hypothetical protein